MSAQLYICLCIEKSISWYLHLTWKCNTCRYWAQCVARYVLWTAACVCVRRALDYVPFGVKIVSVALYFASN